jgi:hypothetical protein
VGLEPTCNQLLFLQGISLRRYSRLVFELIVPRFLPELKIYSVVLPHYFFPVTLNIFRRIHLSSLWFLRLIHCCLGL